MDLKMIIDVRWFCAGHGNVGIVQINDKYDGIKYYVGQCSGLSEELDTDWIAKFGSSFPKDVGDLLFKVQTDH